MTKDGVFAVHCVAILVTLAVGNTSALTGPPDSVCDGQCCLGWDQVGDTCQRHCYYPCEHGTCVETNTCDCDPGWEGQQCQYDIDECWYGQHACHHNCHNHEGCYTCFCDDGFQLTNSTHCVASNGSTTVEPPLMTTVSDSLCVTTTASTAGWTTTNPLQTTTRTTASDARPSSTATTTTAHDVTTRRPQRATSTTALQTSSTARTTEADVTTARRSQEATTDGQQRVTRTTSRGLHISSTTTTTRVDLTTARRLQRTTRTTVSNLHTSSTATTTTARITTAKRPLRTTSTTEGPGRHMTLSVTGPIVQDNPKSPAPQGRTDQRNVDQAIGGAVGAMALLLLLVSLGILAFCKKRKKAIARQERLFSNLPQQPRGSLPGYSDTHWRNPAFENLYEEIPEARSPPPPYEATEGCGATGVFGDVAAMSKGGITDRNNVGMSLAGTIPAIPSKALKEMSPPLCNLHVNIQKEPLADDHGYEPLKKVPGNEYESLKRW